MIAAACKANEHLSWSESIPIMLMIVGLCFVVWIIFHTLNDI